MLIIWAAGLNKTTKTELSNYSHYFLQACEMLKQPLTSSFSCLLHTVVLFYLILAPEASLGSTTRCELCPLSVEQEMM